MPSAMAPLETSTISLPRRAQRGDLPAQRATAVVIETASLVGDEARPDLDDQPRALRADASLIARRRLAGVVDARIGLDRRRALRRRMRLVEIGTNQRAQPSPVIAEISNTGPFQRNAGRTP